MRKTFVDKNGNLQFSDYRDFHVEMPINESNKNEPAAVIQRCRDNNGMYNKELLKKIIDDMSGDAFAKFCQGTRKLQQMADTFHGLAARHWIGIPEDEEDRYWEISHPLAEEEKVKFDDNNQPSEEVYELLKKRVRRFVEIQPGYSYKPINASWQESAIFVTYGRNEPEGITGIGNTPDAAYRDFVSMWNLLRGEEWIPE